MDRSVDPALKLAVVDVLDRDGHARQTVPVWQWPVTIGRAVACDVVLDDVHVAPRHASLTESAGVLSLEVGDTVNGAEWSGTRLGAGTSAPLPSGEIFQLGLTRLRVRRPADAVGPERALVREPRAGRVPLPALIAALPAWIVGTQWLNSDPGTRVTAYIGVLVGVTLGLVVWCGAWALTSKIFRHRFEFWPHARIAARYLLVAQAVETLLPILAFMLGWAILSRISGLAAAAITCAMLAAHLGRVVPSRRRALTAVIAGLFAAGVGVFATMNYQMHDRVFSELYVSTLAPPALRLASPVAPARFLDEARDLKAVLDAHIDDEDGGDDDPYGMELD
jgi:hypothetical protein